MTQSYSKVAIGAALAATLVAAASTAAYAQRPDGPPEGTDVEIDVLAFANNVEHWRADGPAEAAAAVDTWNITVNPTNDDSGDWEAYKRAFTLAADAGEGPDIVVSGHEDIAVWANAGYIVSFEECRTAHPEFDDVIETLWDSATWHGETWGVPQDTEARPLFFNKPKLAELGWSDDEIDALPQRIAEGDFTLDDMIATSVEAIDAGVIEDRNGFWHRPVKGSNFLQYYVASGGRMYDEGEDKLVVTRDALVAWYEFQRGVVDAGITPTNYIGTEWEIWHETVMSGDVLFFDGGTWQWADWAANYVADRGGQDYLFDTFGYAVQPTNVEGAPGVTQSHPLVYMIVSPSASGAENQGVACELLAKTTTPEINTLHAVDSTHLGVLQSQADDPDYTADRFLADALYMLDYTTYQPNHIAYGPYFDALFAGMERAENGDASPEEAAADVIELLGVEIGDQLIVE